MNNEYKFQTIKEDQKIHDATPIVRDGVVVGGYVIEVGDFKVAKCLHLLAIEIAPEHRGKGYGKETVEMIYALGKELHGVDLFAVTATHKDSLGFWKQLDIFSDVFYDAPFPFNTKLGEDCCHLFQRAYTLKGVLAIKKLRKKL